MFYGMREKKIKPEGSPGGNESCADQRLFVNTGRAETETDRRGGNTRLLIISIPAFVLGIMCSVKEISIFLITMKGKLNVNFGSFILAFW